MKRIKLLYNIVVILTVSLMLGGCGNSGIYEETKDGYRNISSIDGITFDVPESLINNSTAITMINNESEFESSQTYLFKDGEEKYLLFNMNSVVIAAQKGTSFDMSMDNESLIGSGDVLGIWFEKDGKKLNMDGTQEKIIADVKGDVSITTEMYDEFYGSLAIVDSGTEQWSIFVGLTNENLVKDEDKKRETIDHIVKSLKMTQAADKEETNEEKEAETTTAENETEYNEFQTEDKESIDTLPETTEIDTDYETEVDIVEIIEVQETENADDSTQEAEEQKITENMTTEVGADDNIDDTEEAIQSTDEELETESHSGVQEIEIPSSEYEEKETNDKNAENNSMNLNNQQITVNNSDEPYLNDIYSLMPIGTTTIFSTYITSDNQPVKGQIKMNVVITGEEAKQFLARHGIYDAAPIGCEWNVAEYETDICPEEAYINIKLRGVDGEALRYRGISYSKKTYDILCDVTESGSIYKNLYCYYAVPKGCRQYVLECGDGTINTGYDVYAGYYLIQIPSK